MLEFLMNPWPWYFGGPLIALVMLFLIWTGNSFGVSSNLRTMCTIAGSSNLSDFFKIDVKKQYWNLAFAVGSMIGGYLTVNYLSIEADILLSESTINRLTSFGFTDIGQEFLPKEFFGLSHLNSVSVILLLLGGGFLVGFGARYAGGCTSGHAISGLSNLQLPSLIAVVGFFIGGLLATHFILPIIFNFLNI